VVDVSVEALEQPTAIKATAIHTDRIRIGAIYSPSVTVSLRLCDLAATRGGDDWRVTKRRTRRNMMRNHMTTKRLSRIAFGVGFALLLGVGGLALADSPDSNPDATTVAPPSTTVPQSVDSTTSLPPTETTLPPSVGQGVVSVPELSGSSLEDRCTGDSDVQPARPRRPWHWASDYQCSVRMCERPHCPDGRDRRSAHRSRTSGRSDRSHRVDAAVAIGRSDK
jgi:hypothetical protein